jgi:plasmid stabilization system protein ParE
MKPLIYSERSLQDVEEILDFIRADRPEAAVHFVEQILG